MMQGAPHLQQALLEYRTAVLYYPGMSVDPGPHPYCHKSLACSVVDMIRAARDSGVLPKCRTRWNGQLYLMGYSEGGYAAMAYPSRR